MLRTELERVWQHARTVRIENFGRNVSFAPANVKFPESAAELSDIVKNAGKVRVMGSRHSWSRAIVTDDTLVSLDRMKRVIHVDREANRVTVEAGIKLKELIVELENDGLALENLGSIADQSLAGAVSTGTHGTGRTYRCLADQVQSLALVDGSGEVRRLDREHPDFDAVVVGLGCFGIVYEMTLSVVPAFQMHFITDTARFDDVIEHLDDYTGAHDHFKMWWLVPTEDVIVFQQTHTQQPRNDSDFKRWFNDELLSVAVYRTCIALERIERKRLVPFVNRVLGGQVGRRNERICKSHVAFLTPVPPRHREAEWAFDYANARELLRDYRKLLLNSGHTYSFIQEIRFSRADDFWLSPGYGRDSIWLSLYNIDSEERWADQLRQIEQFARARDGRPHWGKEAVIDVEYLHAHFPRLREAVELARTYDPDARFVNRWLDGVFGD